MIRKIISYICSVCIISGIILFTPNISFAKEALFVKEETVDSSENIISQSEYNNTLQNLDASYQITKALASYPTSYDPRTYNQVTSIKNQDPYGTCWAYGAVSTVESALIKQGMADSTIDLSELQYVYKKWKESYSNYSYEYSFNQGASLSQVWSNMSQGIGPSYESTFGPVRYYKGDEFDESIVNSRIFDLDKLYYSENNTEDNTNGIKKLITTYGGVFYNANPMSATNDKYNNTGDCSYYNPHNIKMINHAIEIVGWDDNYPAENFISCPKGNGAWLIKNSWGTNCCGKWDPNEQDYLKNSGNTKKAPTGYHWISYYEVSLQNTAASGVVVNQLGTKVTQIEVETANISVDKDKTVQIKAQVIPETALNKKIKYYSDNPSIATVDNNGIITGIKHGKCQISLISEDSIYESFEKSKIITVTVKEPVETEESRIELYENETKAINVTNIKNMTLNYKSANNNIANVEKNGIITAISKGETKITITGTDEIIPTDISVVVLKKEEMTTEQPVISSEPQSVPKTSETEPYFVNSPNLENKSSVCNHTYKQIISPATNESNGEIARICSQCGKTTIIKRIPTINKKGIKISHCYYTGKKVTPNIQVKDVNGNKIDLSQYSVKLSKNKNPGTAKATIISDEYQINIKKSFQIKLKSPKIKRTKEYIKIDSGISKSQPVKYMIEYSNHSNFKKSVVVYSKNERQKINKKYKYIRVKTIIKKVSSKWGYISKKEAVK